jgi:hypothetical protein
MLEGRFPLHLHADPHAPTHGHLAGQAPLQAAGYQPGLWQQLDLTFAQAWTTHPGETPFPPSLVKATLNGVGLHQEALLSTQGLPAAGPMRLELTSGRMHLRTPFIERIEQSDDSLSTRPAQPLQLGKSLRYTYYEREEWNLLADFEGATAVDSGYTEVFDQEKLSRRADHYGLRYQGDFVVRRPGRYQFLLTSDDGSRLHIDGQALIVNDSAHAPVTRQGSIDLSAGTHQFTLEYFEAVGGATLHLAYTGNQLGLTAFYGPLSLRAEGSSPEDYVLEPVDQPLVMRSFLTYPPYQVLTEEATPLRRSHGISVGTPQGNHLALDAATGKLLMLWHGPFANMIHMWASRGDWQSLRPEGPVIALGGQPALAQLKDRASPWPDTIPQASEWQFLGYELDAEGWPTFAYQWQGAQLHDALEATDAAVHRSLRLTDNAGPMYYQLAVGDAIESRGEGRYAVQGAGYLLHLTALQNGALLLRCNQEHEELVWEIPPGGGQLDADFIW